MATARKKKDDGIINIETMPRVETSFAIIGTEPLIMNKMPPQAVKDLIFPPQKKKKEAEVQKLKHIPLNEFRHSAHTAEDLPTWLCFPSSGVRRAMTQAATDIKGVTKAQLNRLMWVNGNFIPIWGKPVVRMDTVTTGGINKAKDIRTRCCVPGWCAVVSITYADSVFNKKQLGNLLMEAGRSCGLGDYRTEKGSGTYGQFTVCNPSDPAFKKLQKFAKVEQIKAMEAAEPIDDEVAEILIWFEEELERRGMKVAA